MLDVKNQSVFYNGHQALKDVSLTIKKGEVVALIGANGAGKSTLLQSIVGLVHGSLAAVYFNGQDISTAEPYKVVELGISLVPQERRLFTEMTVDENLRMGAFAARARKNAGEKLKQILHLFPRLAERKHQVVSTLSGGEQQMVAIGRALMSSPQLLLLDEPSFGLAPNVVENIFKIMKVINNEEGVTIFLVEQNLHTTLAFSERAYILENGRIKMEGTSEELLGDDYVKKAYLGLG